MPLYKYTYTTEEGEKKEETKEFLDKTALYHAVRLNGGTIISAEEAKPSRVSLGFLKFGRRIKAEEVITFARNLGVMIDAGLSVSRALVVLRKQSKNKKMKTVLEELMASVQRGETLSQSLAARGDIFSELFVSMVKAGEESGKLSSSLQTIADQLEKSNNLTKKIKGAMIYPTVVICVMVVIGVVLMVYMVPTLTETFRGLNINLPLPTRIIIAVSDFMIANFILVIGALVAVLLSFLYSLRARKGKNVLDFMVLRIPMIKTMSREINAARSARTLSSLISSGVDIVGAINITSAVVQNHYFKNLLKAASKKVETGELLSVAIIESDNLYPAFVGEMLAVGEETGNLAPMLKNIADYYEGEVDQKTKNLSTIIEPFLMILIGLAVGAFAVAMMLPTYSLVDAIQ